MTDYSLTTCENHLKLLLTSGDMKFFGSSQEKMGVLDVGKVKRDALVILTQPTLVQMITT